MSVAGGIHYGKWQGEAQFGTETTLGTLASTLYRVVLLEEPTVDPGYQAQSRDAVAGRGGSEVYADDSNPSLQMPLVKFAFQPNELLLSKVLNSLFLGGASQAAGAGPPTKTNTYVAYTDGNPASTGSAFKSFSFNKVINASTAAGAWQALGCVSKSVSITFAYGKATRVDVEALAMTVALANCATQASLLTGVQRHMFWDAAFKYAAIGSTPAALSGAPAKGMTLKLTNNAEYDHGNQQTPYTAVAGELGVELSVDLSWRGAAQTLMADLAGTAPVGRRVQVLSGTSGQDGYFDATFDVEWTKVSDKSEGNIARVHLEGTQARATTNGQATTLTVNSVT